MDERIFQISVAGPAYGGEIRGVTYTDLVWVLGVPNVPDDPRKVAASWTVQECGTGRRASVWSYYVPAAMLAENTSWSIHDPDCLLDDLFPGVEIKRSEERLPPPAPPRTGQASLW